MASIKAQPATKEAPAHIFILVAGTSDPVNSDNKKTSRAQSYDTDLGFDPKGRTLKEKLRIEDYKKEAKNYWDANFYSQMQGLTKQYKNFELFPFHGWTGDNSVNNREVAGSYLINRLCGAEGETPYYEEKHQNKKKYFHLIGHSHGGNVMNEMTKQMDKLGSKWPEKWKVKSMTYLSTPFFNDIHQVKVTEKTFHEKAEVLSLYNDYDLTQRVIADFSMHMLEGVNAVLEKNDIKSALENVSKAYTDIPLGYLGWTGFDRKKGTEFYTKSIEFFRALKLLISENIFMVLSELNEDTEYEIAQYFKDTLPKDVLTTKRKILQDDAKDDLKSILQEVIIGISKVEKAFDDRKSENDELAKKTSSIPRIQNRLNNKTTYSRMAVVDDLSQSDELFDALNNLLAVEDNLISQQKNSLWNVLFKILNHNIEKYDNTYVKPDTQFSGTGLNVENVAIAERDSYDIKTRQGEKAGWFTRAMINSSTYGMSNQKSQDLLEPKVFSERYYKFIDRVETLEKNYNANPSQTNLMEILFSLLAQSPVHTMVDKFSGVGFFTLKLVLNGDAEKSIVKLRKTVNKLKKLFDKRYVGELEAFKMGSLDYFMIESHSTSRRILHDDVKDFLTRLGGKKSK